MNNNYLPNHEKPIDGRIGQHRHMEGICACAWWMWTPIGGMTPNTDISYLNPKIALEVPGCYYR